MKSRWLSAAFLAVALAVSACGSAAETVEPAQVSDPDVSDSRDGDVHQLALDCDEEGNCPGGYYCDANWICRSGGGGYATGTVTANPTAVWINTNVTSLGQTQICWQVNNASTGEVWVSDNGQSELLFTRASSGCEFAWWIQVGHTYSFRLYEGTAHSNLLSTVIVAGYGYQALR
ncbi:hypothetical protein [Pyxidicoccus caerfyrddinensis]|uniref:hypothetical protein n=1 Tax=Pyxidicoccus caerfyrddinensis TaxID=2709663 RepID=UPI0013DC490F|nr:hypothetical protein [Pyxidicoccus caerfyrddinensis]